MILAKLIQSLPWYQHYTEDTRSVKGKTQEAQVFKMPHRVCTLFVDENMRFSEKKSRDSNATTKESVQWPPRIIGLMSTLRFGFD